MNRCTGHCDIIEILLKVTLSTIQSYNQFGPISKFYLDEEKLGSCGGKCMLQVSAPILEMNFSINPLLYNLDF